MNANTKPQTVAPIEPTTFDVALRHMKNGGFALARLGTFESDAFDLCFFDRAQNGVRRLALRKSKRRAEEIFAPFERVVSTDWVLLRPDAFVRNPVETATDEAVRATFDEYVAPALSVAAESAEAIETALAEELDAILGTPPTDAARPTEPEPTNGDDVAGSAGYVC